MWTARGVILAALLSVTAVGAQAPPVGGILDRYARGDFDTASALASTLTAPGAIRSFENQARRWIEADRAGVGRRRLTVAIFALDAAQQLVSAEGWESARDLLAWSCTQLRLNTQPDPAERLWHLAAIATMQGAGDWLLVAGRMSATGRAPASGGNQTERELGQGHLSHAMARFPSEARFGLAAVVAADIRQWEVGNFGRDPNLRTGILAGEIDREYLDGLRATAIGKTQVERVVELQIVGEKYAALTKDPGVAGEAHLRAALVRFRLGERTAALTHLAEVHRATNDPYFLFLAHLFTGAIRERQGMESEAIAAYRAALGVVPRAQSATSLLVGRLASAGRQAEAATVAEAFFAGGPPPADPWLTYRFGDGRLMASLMTQLRGEVK
jgi:hypothetical protein